MASKRIRLNECPFCNEKRQTMLAVYQDESGDYFVECRSCFARGPSRVSHISAIRWWNDRESDYEWRMVITADERQARGKVQKGARNDE